MAAAAQPLEPLAAMFEHADISCRISEAIEVEVWTKLVMNCVYNAISARARYGRMARFEPVCTLMQRVITGTVAVAHAEGVSLSEPSMVAAAFRLGEEMSRALSSTAQDIARGRPTEIDSLNGYVARRGAALGIATPVNDALYALVRLLEEPATPRQEWAAVLPLVSGGPFYGWRRLRPQRELSDWRSSRPGVRRTADGGDRGLSAIPGPRPVQADQPTLGVWGVRPLLSSPLPRRRAPPASG